MARDRAAGATGREPRRLRVRLRYGPAGHARARHHRAGGAAAHRVVRRRRHSERCRHVRCFLQRVGRDAVLLFAGPRIAVGLLRTPQGDPALQLRSRDRLRLHGAGADLAVAVRRTRNLGHHLVQLRDGRRLHRRCHAARAAGGEVRPARRRVWRRLHHWADRRRAPLRLRHPRAVLVRGDAEPGERRLRVLHPARVAAAGAARAVSLEERQSDRVDRNASGASTTAWPRRLRVPVAARARLDAEYVRSVHRLSFSLGRPHGRPGCSEPSASHR